MMRFYVHKTVATPHTSPASACCLD